MKNKPAKRGGKPKPAKKKMPSCTQCKKRPSIIHLKYSGPFLCKYCFCELFERRVRKANRDFHLLRRGDRVVAAISGGKDSGAMLWNLCKIARHIGPVEIIPVFIDEGIAGYRDKAKKEAEKLCKMLGLKLTAYSFDKFTGKTLDELIKIRNKSPDLEFRKQKACTICGTFRKYLLNKAALELGANKVAIGHTADDIAQTFLMNILRADIEGVARFGVVSPSDSDDACTVPRIRPLTYELEEECALYARLMGIPHLPKHCPYSVEAFRGLAEDFLNDAEKEYPAIKFNVLRSYLALQKLMPKDALNSEWKKCGKCGMKAMGKECKACGLREKLLVP